MNLTDYFQSVYVINLPQRRDRRREMARQLRKIGLGFRSPGVRLFEAVRPKGPQGFPSIGARGAFLSHLRVLKDASGQNLQRILILEDDVNFVPEFSERIGAVQGELKCNDWSVFYGGYVIPAGLDSKGREGLIQAEPSLGIQTAHFIGLRGQAIQEAVGYLEAMLTRPEGDPLGGPMHVDGAYTWFRHAFPHMLTLLASPQLGYQRSSRSDISTPRWFDSVPGVRQATACLRQLGNRTLT